MSLVAISLSLLLGLGLAACGHNTVTSGRKTLRDQGQTREYWLHIPTGYNANEPTPVVVLFHGWGYSGREWYDGSGWGAVSARDASNENNFILVSPTGVTDSRFPGNCDNGAGYCSWNAAGTTGSPGPEGATCNSGRQRSDYCYRDTCGTCRDICWWTSCVDDTLFVHNLLDEIESMLCVDESRIYAGGESNGGLMSWQMGTDSRAGRFAAFAAVIGLPLHGFNFLPAALPLPIIGIWGNTDRTVPVGNDRDAFTESSDGWYYTAARHITRDWSEAHGCRTAGDPLSYPTKHDGESQLRCTSFSDGCRHGIAPVVDCRFQGGHVVRNFVPDLMWEFFSKHKRNDANTIALSNNASLY